jgi:hypothetical protein
MTASLSLTGDLVFCRVAEILPQARETSRFDRDVWRHIFSVTFGGADTESDSGR